MDDRRLDALYESVLAPRIQAMDGVRREVRGYLLRASILVGGPAVLFVFSDALAIVWPGAGSFAPFAAFGLILVGLVVSATRYLLPGLASFANYRARFKQEVVAEVFTIVCPTARYSPAHGIPAAIFDEPHLFARRGRFSSDDLVTGTIGTTPFEASDVYRHYSTGGKNSRTVVVFRGLFFHLDFNKRLTGRTLVEPSDAAASVLGDRDGLRPVTLENANFAQAFRVHSSDEVEARYILTPAMMERILALKARTTRPLYLAFANNRAYLGVHYGRALFEPAITDTTSAAAVREMAAHFALAEAVVHELDLNTRIWTKDVDTSLLARGAEPASAPLDAALAAGGVTAASLWEAASRSAGEGAADPGPVPRPANSNVQLERSGERISIGYGLSVWMLLAILVSAACAAVAFTAIPLLPDALGVPGLRAWTDWASEWPAPVPLAATYPVPAFAVAALLGSLSLLGWMTRVRRVEATPTEVRVFRGLSPWPRTYPCPPYGTVVRIQGAVYIRRREGLNLVPPSASPMLPEADARWIAWELRQLLDRI